MLGSYVALLLASAAAGSAPTPDLSTPTLTPADLEASPPAREKRRLAIELTARNHAIGGASVVLGAAYFAYLAAILHANLTCENWDPMNPECETTDATRRAIVLGAFAGLAVVPPVLAARGVARADPEVSALRAFWRALPWHVAGVAVAAVAPEAFRTEPVAGLAVLGAAATLSLYLAPGAAARTPPRSPAPAAHTLPVRDPALLR